MGSEMCIRDRLHNAVRWPFQEALQYPIAQAHEETGFEGEAGFHNLKLKVRRDAPAAIFGFRDGSGNPESALFQSIESVVSSNFSLKLREPWDEGTGSLLIITIKISTTPYGLVFYIRDASDFGYQYEHGQDCCTAYPPG